MNKKFLILSLMLILLTFCFVVHKSIANNEISKDNIKKIEEETQICLDKGFAMQNCNYEAINKYKIEIEKILKKFKNKLSQSQYEKLLVSQKKWEEFAKANNELYNEIYDVIPATIMHLFGSQYKKQIYENRLKELYELYNECSTTLKEYSSNNHY